MLNANSEEQCKRILEKSHFETIRKIGRGNYGHVILASKFTTSANFYAVKCISLKRCSKDPHLKGYISQQTKSMCAIDHQNVVRFENSFTDSGWHFIVMEYCDIGNLMSYQLKSSQRILKAQESLHILKQILKGTQAIHKQNIIHRDLKCENILLKKNRTGGYTCKIGDFGFAKIVENTTKTTCGTFLYMAPEVMGNQPYGFEADVWSIGVIFYYLLFGSHPFKNINIEQQIVDKCKQGFILPSIPLSFRGKKEENHLQNFFSRVFEINPKKRITIEQMLNHSIFRNVDLESTSDSTEDHAEQEVQWELQRIKFINQVYQEVLSSQVLDPFLSHAFHFYLLKIMRIFLNQPLVKCFITQQPKHRLTKQIVQESQNIINSLHTQIYFLSSRQQTTKIDKFSEGFNSEIQNFTAIKQAYRNTVGKVYEKIHKNASNEKLRAILKFKVFCCHLINRIFKTKVKEEIFPHFRKWKLAEKTHKSQQISFNELNQWLQKENPHNILAEIENINRIFFGKN